LPTNASPQKAAQAASYQPQKVTQAEFKEKYPSGAISTWNDPIALLRPDISFALSCLVVFDGNQKDGAARRGLRTNTL
jgi:hypothetical protein